MNLKLIGETVLDIALERPEIAVVLEQGNMALAPEQQMHIWANSPFVQPEGVVPRVRRHIAEIYLNALA